jgi:hypothetical protein
MKHGDKAKSKAPSKASGKKISKASTKSRKAGPAIKAKKQTGSQAKKQTPSSSSKSGPPAGNGKPRPRLTPGELTFSNPIVAAAFKRAVKRYANTFRRLTD